MSIPVEQVFVMNESHRLEKIKSATIQKFLGNLSAEEYRTFMDEYGTSHHLNEAYLLDREGNTLRGFLQGILGLFTR